MTGAYRSDVDLDLMSIRILVPRSVAGHSSDGDLYLIRDSNPMPRVAAVLQRHRAARADGCNQR
jgi:hypothetical protein